MVTFPVSFLTSSIGRGDDDDALLTRQALNRTGHLPSSGADDTDLPRGVTRFQADFGLERDAIMDPGGPTESTIAVALEADDLAGTAGVKAMRAPIAALSRAGLKFLRERNYPSSDIAWRDANGWQVLQPRIDPALDAAGQRLAFTPAPRPPTLAHIPSSTDPSDKMSELMRSVFGRPATRVANKNAGASTATNGRAEPAAPIGRRAARTSRTVDRNVFERTCGPTRTQHDAGAGTSTGVRRPASGARTPAPRPPTRLERTLQGAGPERRKTMLDGMESKHRGLVTVGRMVGLDLAADFLEHYFNGKGGTFVVKPDRARSYGPLQDAEHENHGRFEENLLNDKSNGFGKRLLALKDGQSDKFPDYFKVLLERKDFQLSSPDLALAAGTSTLRSDGAFKATRQGNIIHIEATIDHRWKDDYNFHEGKLGAEEPLALKKFRGAKPFKVESGWKRRLVGTVEVRNGALGNPRFTWTDVK